MNLEEIIETMQKYLERGEDVIRLHTGDPSIYSATGEQMDELDKLGIEYEVVPGISSFQAGAAALKAELTCPDVSQVITIARVAGRTPVPEMQELENLAKTRATLCLFLSISLADKITDKLTPYYGEECPVAVVYKAAWPEEKVFRGTLKDLNNIIKENNITRTALIFIGEAIERPGKNKSLLYDKGFAHGYRGAENAD
jgi:precorrin-4/cobalt-precorrin-4 C11-methyltransferase